MDPLRPLRLGSEMTTSNVCTPWVQSHTPLHQEINHAELRGFRFHWSTLSLWRHGRGNPTTHGRDDGFFHRFVSIASTHRSVQAFIRLFPRECTLDMHTPATCHLYGQELRNTSAINRTSSVFIHTLSVRANIWCHKKRGLGTRQLYVVDQQVRHQLFSSPATPASEHP
jgi:hypothetical protein